MKDVEAENDKSVDEMTRDSKRVARKKPRRDIQKAWKLQRARIVVANMEWNKRAQHKVNCVLSVINQTIIRECVEAKPFMIVIYLSERLKMKVKTKSRLAWEISLMSWVVV